MAKDGFRAGFGGARFGPSGAVPPGVVFAEIGEDMPPADV